ncbi:MAG: glycosyltransferase family 2 protein [Candidatus Levybacteria bacterium]|nr:glycosyltransferase family 2 protein [Candidatus Levybacteria bacterium]
MKNKASELVSILMPAHNAEAYIKYAIESIINQRYKNWELICINDSSTDKTQDILKKYQKLDSRIKVYKNSVKKGIGFSLNLGLKYAQGKFIARMDADDISFPERISKQVEFLTKNKRVVACGGQVAMINSKNEIFAYKYFPTNSKALYKMIMKLIPLQHPTIMARSKVIKNYKYDTTLEVAEDVDMLFYLLSKGEINNLEDVIYQYRKHNNSNSYIHVKKTFYTTFISRFKAIKKYGYKPSVSGISISILELLLITFMPSKVILNIFEAIRFYPPLVNKLRETLTITNPTINISGRNPK